MQGLLLPILKKSNIDLSIPKNYRPVVISNTFTGSFEVHMLDMCGIYAFHDLQFGFVSGRGTTMAAALAHDVFDYCVN